MTNELQGTFLLAVRWDGLGGMLDLCGTGAYDSFYREMISGFERLQTLHSHIIQVYLI